MFLFFGPGFAGSVKKNPKNRPQILFWRGSPANSGIILFCFLPRSPAATSSAHGTAVWGGPCGPACRDGRGGCGLGRAVWEKPPKL